MKSYVYMNVFALLIGITVSSGEPATNKTETKKQGGGTVAYYDIEGETADLIRIQLNLHGPPDPRGASHDAHTLWGISWKLPPSGDPAWTEVSCNIMIILPKLKNIERVPKELKEKWNRYVTLLIQHEMAPMLRLHANAETKSRKKSGSRLQRKPIRLLIQFSQNTRTRKSFLI